MPVGMTPAAPEAMGFKTMATVDEAGNQTSFHVVPYDQFVHELDMEATCVCGPDVSYQHMSTRVVPIVSHWALDPRYYEDLPRDWGDDGPVHSRT